MSLFSDDEYTDFDERPDLDDAWSRLPVAVTIDGIGVRWLGPLVELGHDRWMGDLAEAAWGHLEECGWQEVLHGAGAMLDDEGVLSESWATAFGAAARRLAAAAEYAGPEDRVDRWAAWVAWEYAAPHAYLKKLATENGWDR